MTQALLDVIVGLLNQGGSNYTVFLRLYELKETAECDPQSKVAVALGEDALIGGIEEVTGTEVISEIENCLQYSGDSDAGPQASVFKSSFFEKMLAELNGELVALVESSSKIEKFWLKSGHPAYPVFWDFATLFTRKGGSVILIGSSSD